MDASPTTKPDPVRYLPALAVFLFLLHLGWVLVDPDKPLSDPGTGWHIKLGQLLLEQGGLPATDPLSFSLPGRPWMDYQWLTHGVMGLLWQAGGLPLVTAFWSVLFGSIPILMMRRLMREGVPVVAAFLLAFLAYLILTMHAQVRPHVWTYVFLLLLLEILREIPPDGRGLAVRGPVLVVLFVFWTNLHPGFMAGLLVLACYAGGNLLGAAVETRALPLVPFARWATLGSVCVLSTLLNPWGWDLHRHVGDLLGMKAVAYWDEYQPVWRHDGANVALFYGMVLLWLGGVVFRFRSLRAGEVVTGAVLLFFAFQSIRHVNLFVLAGLPVVGRTVGILPSWSDSVSEKLMRERQLRFWPTWGYAGIVGMLFCFWAVAVPSCFRRDLAGLPLSPKMLAAVRELPPGDRLFHPEYLGGVLAYTLGPERKIFVDDRLDYYGDDFYLKTYLPLLAGAPGWRELLDQQRLEAALLPRGSRLQREISATIDWGEWASDADYVLYRRKP